MNEPAGKGGDGLPMNAPRIYGDEPISEQWTPPAGKGAPPEALTEGAIYDVLVKVWRENRDQLPSERLRRCARALAARSPSGEQK